MSEAGAGTKSNWWTTLGWAAYLACSWTWCIGMFLPVLLVRDYGIMGFVVFAIPNVVGAAAMGWVVRDAEHSTRIVRSHERLIGVFSGVTILFQLFFFVPMWLAFTPSGAAFHSISTNWRTALPLTLVLPGILLSAMLLSGRGRQRHLASFGVLGISAVAAAFMLGNGSLGWPPAAVVSGPPIDVTLIGASCMFGFVACPYLDRTFHLARSALPRSAAKLAFAIGFGVFFSGMILLTFFYASQFLSDGGARSLWLEVHVWTQLVFTILAHSGVVNAQSGKKSRVSSRGIVDALLIAMFVLGAFVIPWLKGEINAEPSPWNYFEQVYRVLMSAYGLFFPAYVWLCMIPTWHDPKPPTRRMLVIWAAACALAAPAFWMGFIEREEVWLAPGLAVVLLARLLIPSVGRTRHDNGGGEGEEVDSGSASIPHT